MGLRLARAPNHYFLRESAKQCVHRHSRPVPLPVAAAGLAMPGVAVRVAALNIREAYCQYESCPVNVFARNICSIHGHQVGSEQNG